MRVAIVDDQRADSAALYGLLTEAMPMLTFVDVYDSGERFLDSSAQYDLVFLDILMEGLDGIETARRLRKRDIAGV